MVRLIGYESLSTIDWIGNLSMVLFFAGCNYRCRYCYNHEYIPMDSGEEYTLEEIYQLIDENEGIFDSIVITGGEPTMQYESLRAICKYAQSKGYPVMLDTNGSRPKLIEELIQDKLIDKIALDIKVPLAPTPYMEMCNVDRYTYIKVRDTLKKCNRIDMEVRTTVVPNSWADYKHTKHIISMIRSFGVKEFHLQQFDSKDPLDKSLQGIETVSIEVLEELADYAKVSGISRVVIKGASGINIK